MASVYVKQALISRMMALRVGVGVRGETTSRTTSGRAVLLCLNVQVAVE
jgi:hypothetical protein